MTGYTDSYCTKSRLEFRLSGDILQARVSSRGWRTSYFISESNRTASYFSGEGWDIAEYGNISYWGYGLDVLKFSLSSPINNTIDCLEEKTYGVYVKDNEGCNSEVKTIRITEPDSVLFSIDTLVNVTCNGGTDGSIEIVKEGGVMDILEGGNTEYKAELSKTGYVNDFYKMDITLKDRRNLITDIASRITTLSFTKDQLINGGNDFSPVVTDIQGYK